MANNQPSTVGNCINYCFNLKAIERKYVYWVSWFGLVKILFQKPFNVIKVRCCILTPKVKVWFEIQLHADEVRVRFEMCVKQR